MSQTVRAALTPRFEAANRDGGIYGRRIEPRFFDAPGPADQRPVLRRRRRRRRDGRAVRGEAGLPVVGPFSLHRREEAPLNRYVFYLLPGIETQEKVLAAFAARQG